MRERMLTFFVAGVLTVIVFIFFFFQTQPVNVPKPPTPVSSADALQTPTVTFINPSRGPATAKISLVEFGDFECTVCNQMNPVLDSVLATFPKDVKLVWKNMPNDSAHPHATAAAIAAYCAGQQGKFWEYGKALFDQQTILSDSLYPQIASSLGLDANKFAACVSSKDPLPIVQKDTDEGTALGIVATPTIFIGSQRFVGLSTADQLNTAITQELANLQQTHAPAPAK